MTEGNANIEFAEHLRSHGLEQDAGARKLRLEMLEILEAVALAIVALATALSGFQAATWDGVSAREYARSSRLSISAQAAMLSGNQSLMYNAGTVTAWLQAKSSGNDKLAEILAGRFTPDYKPAFDAWVKTHPLTNPDAPPGPMSMPQYRNENVDRAKSLNEESSTVFEEAVHARHTGENYVRLTVILAAVLFLIALSQRFRIRPVRWTVLAVAGGFLAYSVVLLIAYPRV